jgi:hypothetical protein
VWLTLTIVLIVVGAFSGPWPARTADVDWPTELQYGIRWFGKGNVRLPGYDTYPPLHNAPTVILVHGWQPGTGQTGTKTSKMMVNFNYVRIDSKYGEDGNLADAWIDKGWNVGAFYWTPLSDEATVEDAQDKIWTTHGAQGMRYRLNDTYYDSKLNQTVAELFFASYLKVFSNATWAQNPIRLLGHSLGSQIVNRASKMLAERANASLLPLYLLPSHVVLLDPYMGNGVQPYLNTTIGNFINYNWIRILRAYPETALTVYQSSDINFLSGNGNSGEYLQLVQQATLVRVHGNWIESMDFNKLGNQHVAAMAIYMKSFVRPSVPSAGASDRDMAKLMGVGLIEQTSGGDTFDALDDEFTTTDWATLKDYKGPSPGVFWAVVAAMIAMGFVSLWICCCCLCCMCHHRCKCHLPQQSDDIQQYTYQAADFSR